MTASTWISAAVGAAGVALIGLYGSNYQLFILATVALTAMVGIGLNILVGLTGQISLGQAAFFAIGAYVVGIATTKYGISFWPALPLAGLVSGLIGTLLAIPALRVRGPYLAMLTIAFGFIVEQVAAEWIGLTGGWNGLSGIDPPSFAGIALAERGIAFLALLLTLLTLLFYVRLSHSAWGQAMRAVRDSETAAQSIGLNPVVVKTAAFTIAAAIAGIAGGVFAVLNSYISPESFPFTQSILFLLVVMIGGAEYAIGPVIGAVIVVLLPELLSSLAQYRLLFVGLLLLLVLRLAPGGFASLLGVGRRLGQAKRDPTGLALPEDVGSRETLDPTYTFEAPKHAGIEARDLAIDFGGVRAVNGLSFAARAGAITSLIGPNGAGKSTALNLICGFYAPETGRILIGDRDITAAKPHAIARVGLARTYQTTQLFGQMSVLDNVIVAVGRGRLRLAALVSQTSRREGHDAARALLAFVGYRGPLDVTAASLPHVDRCLVEIARALALRPSVIALDEPAAGLDHDDTQRLGQLLRKLADAGLAVILVEHDMSLVMAISDHVVVLDAGAKIAEGVAQEVARNPQVLNAYLGEGAARDRKRRQPLGPDAATVLDTRGLASGYGAIPVIREIDIEVRQGELVAVLGANGAGKSTLMRALTGLNRPIGGEVRLLGKRIDGASATGIAGLGLALVPEGRQVFAELSTIDNLRLGGMQLDAASLAAEVERMFVRFPRLEERADRRAGLLSGGEQQMLAIARGLIARPRVLLLDEPSLGLAPLLVGQLYDLIEELRDGGQTILLVDQNAEQALSVADRAYVLQSGRVVRAGTAAELRADETIASTYLGVQAVADGSSSGG
jgi:branched-chain amino acid transport system ATP-binding protein